MTNIFTNDDIRAAIEQHADPSHDATPTVEDVTALLAEITEDLVEHWNEHLDSFEDDRVYEVVHEDRSVLVVADHGGYFWGEQLDVLGVEDQSFARIVMSAHRAVAARYADWNWTNIDPFVLEKPAAWQAGEHHLERRVAQIASTGCSEAAAMDYWAVEIKGMSQSMWAGFVGKDQSTVSENIQKAKTALGEEGRE